MQPIDYVGYISMAAVLISLAAFKSRIKFYTVNAVGCIGLGFYAFQIHSIPVLCLCLAVGIYDIYRLHQRFHIQSTFDILEVDPDGFVCKFYCEKNKKALDAAFGINAINDAKNAVFIFRDNDIVGLIAYTVTEPGTARICIDYVSPKYQDGATGKHFFIKDLSFWHNRNIEKLEVYAPNPKNIPYIEKLGFKQSIDPATWEKEL